MTKRNSTEIVQGQIGNTKQSAALKVWHFVLNNWTEEEYSTLVQYFIQNNDKYIIGKEIGEKGTPHLQGHVELNKRKRFSALEKINTRIHWEPVRNKMANREYCKKDGDYETNIRMQRPFIWPTFDRWWQIDILKLINEIPDDRTIHWYWEPEGGMGKTTFTKYLVKEKFCWMVPTKTNDAFHALAKIHEREEIIETVIFDIPRTSLNYINYQSIEKIKDGAIVSGKYEGCMLIIPCPHVIVFANEPPDISQMSMGRWKIIRIV